MKNRFIAALGLGVLAFSLTGCPPKAQVRKEPPKSDDLSQTPPSQEPSLRGKEYQDVPELVVVYFDLDQASLRSDARGLLQKNYEALKTHPDWEALIEGHCDERGTTEYNLGLGQRRAAVVRDYYMSLGIPGTRVATISYGKEKPACEEHNDSCWAQNRRAVTKVRINADKSTSDSK